MSPEKTPTPEVTYSVTSGDLIVAVRAAISERLTLLNGMSKDEIASKLAIAAVSAFVATLTVDDPSAHQPAANHVDLFEVGKWLSKRCAVSSLGISHHSNDLAYVDITLRVLGGVDLDNGVVTLFIKLRNGEF